MFSNEERQEETAMLENATAELLGENENTTSGTLGSQDHNSRINLIKKKLFWPELEQA